jgi:hypothetical protein
VNPLVELMSLCSDIKKQLLRHFFQPVDFSSYLIPSFLAPLRVCKKCGHFCLVRWLLLMKM